MQSTNKPLPFLTPFAQNDGARTEIPATTPDATRMSQSLGSPPLTGMPPEAGGVPPQLSDFNGAMNQVARVPWWTLLGGRFAYDADWATNALIGGYPRGAVLPAALGAGSVGLGEWYNTAENNVANPDVAGTGWVPGYQYGATVLTAQTGGTVVLTPAQAAKTTIRVSGTLTSNLILVVPDWVYAWAVYNTTTGAFSVSIKNAATAAVVIPQDGTLTDIRGDGTAVSRNVQSIPAASQIAAGIQRNGTNPEVAAGALSNVTVTPSALAPLLTAKASLTGAAFTGALSVVNDSQALTFGVGPGQRYYFSYNDGGLSLNTCNLSGAYLSTSFTIDRTTSWVNFGQAVSVANASQAIVFGGAASGQRYYFSYNDTGIALNACNLDGSYLSTPLSIARATSMANFAGAVVATGGFQNGSSRTVKDHVEDLDPTECLRSVLDLGPVVYTYRGSDVEREGYYAEQAAQSGFDRAVTEDDSPGAFSPLLVEDSQLLPRHTGAIQALHTMILELQAKVRELEGR